MGEAPAQNDVGHPLVPCGAASRSAWARLSRVSCRKPSGVVPRCSRNAICNPRFEIPAARATSSSVIGWSRCASMQVSASRKCLGRGAAAQEQGLMVVPRFEQPRQDSAFELSRHQPRPAGRLACVHLGYQPLHQPAKRRPRTAGQIERPVKGQRPVRQPVKLRGQMVADIAEGGDSPVASPSSAATCATIPRSLPWCRRQGTASGGSTFC